ncbi:MAG: hypothetical protein U0610_30035 [bacterium]
MDDQEAGVVEKSKPYSGLSTAAVLDQVDVAVTVGGDGHRHEAGSP